MLRPTRTGRCRACCNRVADIASSRPRCRPPPPSEIGSSGVFKVAEHDHCAKRCARVYGRSPDASTYLWLIASTDSSALVFPFSSPPRIFHTRITIFTRSPIRLNLSPTSNTLPLHEISPTTGPSAWSGRPAVYDQAHPPAACPRSEYFTNPPARIHASAASLGQSSPPAWLLLSIAHALLGLCGTEMRVYRDPVT